ncbi:methyl-accepting chemotaxis protein [Aestuariibacter halophilus]|uniref:Methyl-accepting chemotaxis protein n=1 Tax=Fluctibacter halophilus TaxID=226011 RepID=A0ABS8GD02_9ALTE|nr:methyl-accepting chemotaxis protein [Aestuariibacter halophilus]MCC2618258.1 methyl-accepting chemotaxis protein [Aestuariibacter halophilus]
MNAIKPVLRVLLPLLLITITLVFTDSPWWVTLLVDVIVIITLLMDTVLQTSATARQEMSSAEPMSEQLAQVGNAISHATSGIAIGGASVSHFMDTLTHAFQLQASSVKEMVERITALEDGNKVLLNHAEVGLEKTRETDDNNQQCNALLTDVLTQQTELVAQIESAKTLVGNLKQRADSISSITTTINQLADQTNMLALNAAIEAARAGEQGRGFAVVADEVRDLAKKTADATHGIDTLLQEINEGSAQSVAAIEKVSSGGEAVSALIDQTSSLVQATSEFSTQASDAMQELGDEVKLQWDRSSGISQHIKTLNEANQTLESDLEEVSDKVLSLSHQTEEIYRHIDTLNVSDRNFVVKQIAVNAAKAVGRLFEEAIQQGRISESALFSFNYEPVPDTNPQKFTTPFDRFTDATLPDIQEPILQQNSFITFAGAVDINGYFPTHNKKFSQPMTGNYERDLAASRTKRIFNDYTGSRCGKNTEAFLLQTYKRDTGEIMHDLSAPIYVNGKHWGGFRIGYQAEVD